MAEIARCFSRWTVPLARVTTSVYIERKREATRDSYEKEELENNIKCQGERADHFASKIASY